MTYRTEKIIERLNNAYGTSTPSCNRFAKVINSIKWEEIFEADGETYFTLGELTLTAENINPFKEMWKPTVMVGTFFKELGWL